MKKNKTMGHLTYNTIFTFLLMSICFTTYGQSKKFVYHLTESGKKLKNEDPENVYFPSQKPSDKISLTLTKQTDGFYMIGGDKVFQDIFRDMAIKIEDFKIIYKLTEDNTIIYTYFDCKKIASRNSEYEKTIEVSKNDKVRRKEKNYTFPIVNIDYNNRKESKVEHCGKKYDIYEFRLYTLYSDDPILVGFTPKIGITYIGFVYSGFLPKNIYYKLDCTYSGNTSSIIEAESFPKNKKDEQK